MNKLRDAALQALDGLIESARLLGATQAKKLYGCYSQEDGRLERAWHENIAKLSATIRAALDEPEPQSEPVAFTFAGLTVREIQIPAGMTVRIDRDAIIVARQRDQNDPLIVEPQHDPSHLPYAALAEPQPQPEPVAPPQRQPQPDLQDLWREAQQPQWDAAHRQIDADVAAGVLAEMDEVERLQAERDALLAEVERLKREIYDMAGDLTVLRATKQMQAAINAAKEDK